MSTPELCQTSNASASKGECPFAPKTYTVHFEPLPEGNLWRKMRAFAKEIGSRVSLSSIKSAWQVGSQNDLSKPFLDAWRAGSYVSEFACPTGTVYLTADPMVMRAVFSHSRKEVGGLFSDFENKRIFVERILKSLYPEEIQKIGIEKAADLLVISAEASQAALIRAPLIKALGPSAISTHSPFLNEVAEAILMNLTEEEKGACDASQISFEYTVTVISRLFTGYDASREGYQNLAKALDAFSKRMTQVVSQRRPTQEEEKGYENALLEMKKVIEGCLFSPNAFVQGLKDAGWNDFQIQANLFFLYFAGTETTASAINYLLWQLGKDHPLQQAIRDNGKKILLKAVAETLRIHPPAFVEGRQLRQDTLMTIKDKNQNPIWKKELLKGHSICCLTQAAGRDPILYPEPEQFNPYRFSDEDPRIAALSFLPFGSGPHMCPGQHLALAELQTFAHCILSRFSLHTLSPENREQKGFFTLRATPAKLKLTSLPSSNLL